MSPREDTIRRLVDEELDQVAGGIESAHDWPTVHRLPLCARLCIISAACILSWALLAIALDWLLDLIL